MHNKVKLRLKEANNSYSAMKDMFLLKMKDKRYVRTVTSNKKEAIRYLSASHSNICA